jgi:hypothetical protein
VLLNIGKGSILIGKHLLMIYEKGKQLIQKRETKLNIFLVTGILFFTIPLGSLISQEIHSDATLPPGTPTCISPYHGSFDVDINTYLEWKCDDPDDDIKYYEIYFGKNTNPSKMTTQTSTMYNLSNLAYETKYYWKITAFDAKDHSKTSPVFNFTTKQNTSNNENSRDENHTVFIEFAVSVWGEECPRIKDILHELHDDEALRFHYVTLVYDENENAHARLSNEYNIHDFPTTYIDAGYYVFDLNSDKTYGKADFKNKISAAMNRNTKKVSIDVQCILHNNTDTFDTTVTIYNDESESYTGCLKLYLVEKKSHWYDYDGSAFDFGFINYIINQNVKISPNDEIETSAQWSVTDLNPENLRVIAVLFTDKPIEKDSNPSSPSHYHGFQAYYAEEVSYADIIDSDNLPPEIGIEYPKKLHVNIFGKSPIMDPLWKNTILIGRTTVKAVASDDSKIEKVEFSIDSVLKETVTQEPYQYTSHKKTHHYCHRL